MILKSLKFSIPSPSTGIGLIILALTQLPLAINQSLKIACFVTTSSDYAAFWSWQEIPLDARVHYCQGGMTSQSLKIGKPTTSESNSP